MIASIDLQNYFCYRIFLIQCWLDHHSWRVATPLLQRLPSSFGQDGQVEAWLLLWCGGRHSQVILGRGSHSCILLHSIMSRVALIIIVTWWWGKVGEDWSIFLVFISYWLAMVNTEQNISIKQEFIIDMADGLQWKERADLEMESLSCIYMTRKILLIRAIKEAAQNRNLARHFGKHPENRIGHCFHLTLKMFLWYFTSNLILNFRNELFSE